MEFRNFQIDSFNYYTCDDLIKDLRAFSHSLLSAYISGKTTKGAMQNAWLEGESPSKHLSSPLSTWRTLLSDSRRLSAPVTFQSSRHANLHLPPANISMAAIILFHCPANNVRWTRRRWWCEIMKDTYPRAHSCIIRSIKRKFFARYAD